MINNVFFSIISTSWIWVVFGIQNKWSLFESSYFLTALLLALVPLALTIVWIRFAKRFFSSDSIEDGCEQIEEIGSDFLPTYLGYFFIGIGISDIDVLISVYVIILSFTLLSQNKLFNPLLLLLGYKYYNVLSSRGTNILLITQKRIRNPKNICIDKLRRINDNTYIDVGGK